VFSSPVIRRPGPSACGASAFYSGRSIPCLSTTLYTRNADRFVGIADLVEVTV
jgi:hypothetical protein